MGDPGSTEYEPRPWAPQARQMGHIYGRGRETYDFARERDRLPEGLDSALAPRDPAYTEAIDRLEARGRAGSLVTDPALQETAHTLQGGYLGANPFLSEMYGRAAEDVGRAYQRTTLPALESRFGGARRVNSPAYQSAYAESQRMLGDRLSNMAANLYGSEYSRERNRMGAAARTAPYIQGMDVRDIDTLRMAGGAREARSQQEIAEQLDEYDWAVENPWAQAERFMGLLGTPIVGGVNRQRGMAAHIANVGNVSNTAQGWGNMAMGGMMGGMMMCHGAAVYFGWGTPKWYAARDAIAGGMLGDAFREWYAENSERLAEILRGDAYLRDLWRPVFEQAAELGGAT